MKITFVAKPNSNKHQALSLLCEECHLREIDRTVIGTNEDNIVLTITYEGPSDWYKLFDNKHYVWFPIGSDLMSPQIFFSLDCLDGFTGYLDDFKKFKDFIKKKKPVEISILPD